MDLRGTRIDLMKLGDSDRMADISMTHASRSARSKIERAVEEIDASLRAWRLWVLFGNLDVKLRYRRSVLGPFWATLSTAVQILVMAFVMGFLFNSPLHRYLPFLCIGMVLWGVFTGMVTEGASAFIASSELILQVKRPLLVYVFQVVWRHIIIGAHTIVIFFVVAVIFGVYPGPTYLLEIPGLALFLINCVWMAAVAAIVSARFRDIPLIITNALTALFWLTPVLYEPDQMPYRMQIVIALNPLAHIMQVARAPLLLESPSLLNWLVAVVTALVGWLVAVLLFARSRERIPYWL
jgi:ABC-type polysaccharide/polyol phosphate export permease